uniref:Fructose transporter 1 n=1 Tax=Ganoderma boninense TaxID=34458 RepID=A0A5K1JYQ0_9APHY|nr:Fructose transporter 1 [Ganoderma boninense]
MGLAGVVSGPLVRSSRRIVVVSESESESVVKSPLPARNNSSVQLFWFVVSTRKFNLDFDFDFDFDFSLDFSLDLDFIFIF